MYLLGKKKRKIPAWSSRLESRRQIVGQLASEGVFETRVSSFDPPSLSGRRGAVPSVSRPHDDICIKYSYYTGPMDRWYGPVNTGNWQNLVRSRHVSVRTRLFTVSTGTCLESVSKV